MISLSNVSKQFGSDFALKNISFEAKSGQITGVIGNNGSGKSTIMRMISGLLKPTTGVITINDIDISKYPQTIKSRVGVLLGSDVCLYDNLTAKENIVYYARLYGMTHDHIRLSLKRLVKLLKMEKYIDKKVSGFSRGMKQKVAFARSIIHSPDIILLDEPSTGLDISSIIDVQRFIIYCKQEGKTILLSTHNQYEINQMCDEIVLLENGIIKEIGNKQSILERNNINEITDLFFLARE